ncbi:IclR family transcriptional regulator [Allopusillimonas ginsengisoli]|nr:IclR family transcriptional regulator [Allopusillimonas ginsengisoli]
MTYLSAIQQGKPQLEDFEGDPQFAMTLAKGLELLSAFTPEKPVMSNKELSTLLGMSKSTVSRFTYTLTSLGYMTIEKQSGKFQLGTAVLPIGYPLLANMAIRPIARPLMSELAESIRGSVCMGVLDRLCITYVETSRHRSVFNTRMSDIGLSVSLAGSAIGRAYFCGLAPEARTMLLNTLRIKKPEEWARHSDALEKGMEDYKKHEFCMATGDIFPDVYGVGVPFSGAGQGELLVFNCVVHSYQGKNGALENDIGPRLLSMVKNLESFVLPHKRS